MLDDIDNTITEEHIRVSFKIKEHDYLVAHMLLNSAIFITSGDGERLGLAAIVNDTWGPYADCEIIPYRQIPVLYRLWQRKGYAGVCAWVTVRRLKAPRFRDAESAYLTNAGFDVAELEAGRLPDWAFT